VLDEGLVTSAEEIEIAEESWLFFVDREPGAAFLHPTVFVLVGRDTETLQEYGRDAPPRVDGITLFATPEERENARLRIAGFPYFDFSERSATTSTLPTGVTLGAGVDIPDPIPVDNLRPSPAELDDLLGLYNPDRNETAEAFERRVEGYFERLQPEEIVDAELEKCRCAGATSNKLALLIDGGGFEEGESAPLAAHLRGQGFEVQYLAPDQPDTPGAENARTTIPAIDRAFENLAAQIEDCCDEILVILNGHGSPDGFFLANPQLTINVLDNQGEPTGETKIVGDVNGGFLFTAALKAHLNTLRSCRTTVLIDSCFSGTHLEGGLNSITAEDAPGCLCRTVMVSSSARQFSFGGALGELTETLTSGGSLADAYRAMRDKMSPPVRDDRRHRQTPQVQSTACTLCEDADGDGIVTGEELADGFSDPTNPDTDGDGLLDGAEKTERTDPRNPDSDDDGLTDGEEVLTHGTDPLDRDSDDDGLTDQNEIFLTTDPLDPDTDMGGVNDGEEVLRGTNPLDPSDDDPPPATATEAPTFTATTAPTQTPTATHTPTASFTNTPTPTASLTPTDTAAVVSGPITAKLLGDTPLGSQNKPVMSVAAPVIDPQGFVDVVTFAGTDTFDLSVLVARLDDIPNGDNLIAPARQGAAPPVEVLVEEGETVPNSTAVIGGIRDLNAGTDGEFALLATDQGNSIVRLVSGGPVVPVLGVGAPGARADFDPSKYVVGGGDVVAVAVDGEGNTAIVTADLADPAITVPILATGDSFGGGTVTEVFALDPIFANASNRGTARIEIDDGPDVIISYDTNSGGPTAVLTEGEAAPGFAPGVNILRFTSSARINDAGFIAVLARVFGTGISNANDEVVYVLDSDGQLAGRVQEGTQVPGAAPGTVITLPSAPIMGPTGAFFLHRQVAADMSSPRGVGFVDLGGSFRTIALAGTAAPGGGVFDEFTNAYAMNADGLLVFRARLEDNSSAYYLVDTSDAESEPVRLIGPGDVTSLPQGGTATIASVGTIPDTGGQSGDPNALNQTQLTLSARLDTDQAAVLVVDLP
jgi:hypothetical protein